MWTVYDSVCVHRGDEKNKKKEIETNKTRKEETARMSFNTEAPLSFVPCQGRARKKSGLPVGRATALYQMFVH